MVASGLKHYTATSRTVDFFNILSNNKNGNGINFKQTFGLKLVESAFAFRTCIIKYSVFVIYNQDCHS